eukprot:TRINITY_DN13537_c0_g2_i2.p1 TRINITY_DN13537_c0_g2~~TRINITY_DN13537_c0_g2_i2.p1  ORF type:complete len:101 (-),score=4.10 TRINITY_DN13537_c0_g2_i2:54-356(-)
MTHLLLQWNLIDDLPLIKVEFDQIDTTAFRFNSLPDPDSWHQGHITITIQNDQFALFELHTTLCVAQLGLAHKWGGCDQQWPALHGQRDVRLPIKNSLIC